MKKFIVTMFAVMLGFPSVNAQTGNSMYDENYFVQIFKEKDKIKPSYVGIFHKDKAGALRQLMVEQAKEWGMVIPGSESEMRAVAEDHIPKYDEVDVSDAALQKKVEEIEKQRKDALKQIDAIPNGYADKAQLKKEINKNFDQMLAQLPGTYQDMQKKKDEDIRQNQERKVTLDDMEVSVETLQGYVGYMDDFASRLTPEQKAAFKEKVRQLAVGKKLWKDARGFRYGRAAVFSDSGWGFIDTDGREVIPCKYAQVYNFRNQNHTLSEAMTGNKDKDSRMWTTVIVAVKGEGYNAGMVDANGREVIPTKFIPHSSGYDQIVFLQTPWGEYARVQERASKKHGIIDRSGNYTLPPTYTDIILWNEERRCFNVYDAAAKRSTYFDYQGNIIEIKDYN